MYKKEDSAVVAAKSAARKKLNKYRNLVSRYIFVPLVVATGRFAGAAMRISL